MKYLNLIIRGFFCENIMPATLSECLEGRCGRNRKYRLIISTKGTVKSNRETKIKHREVNNEFSPQNVELFFCHKYHQYISLKQDICLSQKTSTHKHVNLKLCNTDEPSILNEICISSAKNRQKMAA